MKIIQKEDVGGYKIIVAGGQGPRSECAVNLTKAMDSTEVGQAVMVEAEEWTNKTPPQIVIAGKTFSRRTLEGRKGWLVLRTK